MIANGIILVLVGVWLILVELAKMLDRIQWKEIEKYQNDIFILVLYCCCSRWLGRYCSEGFLAAAISQVLMTIQDCQEPIKDCLRGT